MHKLADRIEREGALPAVDAAGWVMRVARRVESLHALGVAHGALSADCLMIEANAASSRGVLVDARRLPTVPAFHSPERAAGEQISQSDDTWAVAVILYVSLTGRLPFSGATDEEVRSRILEAQPTPLAAFGLDEDGLQRVLDAALARDKGQRIVAVQALRLAIEEAKPEAKLARLHPLDDDEDDDEDDDKTILRPSLRGITPAILPAAGRPYAPATPLRALKHTVPMNQAPVVPPAPPSQPVAAHVESPSGSRQFAPPSQPHIAGAEGGRAAPRDAGAEGGRAAPRVESASSPSWQLGPASTPYPHPASTPHAQASSPGAAARPTGAGKLWLVPAAAFAALLVTAAVLFVGPAIRNKAPLATPAASNAPDDVPDASSTTATSSAEPASPSPAPPEDAETAADPTACMEPLFASDTWDPEPRPDLAFVCTETDPRKGGQAVRAEVVRCSGQKRISEGMREWAALGWYEMAAFVALRARCCPAAPPITPPTPVGTCASLGESLEGIAKIAAPGASDADVDAALTEYTRAVRCIVGTGQTTGYAKPQGGEDTAAKKTLSRAAAAIQKD